MLETAGSKCWRGWVASAGDGGKQVMETVGRKCWRRWEASDGDGG